jgi:hypothetical protein
MSSPYTDLPLAEVQEAASEAYEIYGELGRGTRGYPIYLARERSNNARMVLLELLPVGADAAGGTEYALEFRGEVQTPGSVSGRICPSCGASDPRSGRFCARCRYNFSDASGPIQSREDLLEQVRQQTSNTYDILGEIDHAQGQGIVYFARDRGTGALVALRLQYAGAGPNGEEYSLDVTQGGDSLQAVLPEKDESGPDAERHTTLLRRRGLARRSAEPDEFSADALPSGWGRDRVRRRSRRMHWAVSVMGVLFLAGTVVLGVAYWRRSQPADSSGGAIAVDTSPLPLPETAVLPPADPVPSDSAPATPSKLRLRIKSLPSGAVLKVDSVPADSLLALVGPGSHRLSVVAPGYNQLVKVVEVSADTILDLLDDMASLKRRPAVVSPTPIVSSCLYPGDQYNATNECYDEPPKLKRGSTRVQLPSDFDGTPRSSTVWAKISAAGRTLEVEPSKRSLPGFEELAFRRAYSLEWDPARKNGNAVAGWVEVEIKPVRP